MDRKYILAINPGSTSTKLSLFEGEKEVKSRKLDHSQEDIKGFSTIYEQYDYRLELIRSWLQAEDVQGRSLRAVVGRGGLLRSIPGGTYGVSDLMGQDLKVGVQGEHASNLGGLLARGIGDGEGIPSYIVDPVSVDEFEPLARISGLSLIERRSLVHALNIKAVSHRRARELNKDLDQLNLLVAHLGGGISIAPLEGGRIIDVNNAKEMGPFSPDRTGGLPVGDLVDLCFSNKYSEKEMKSLINNKGGLVSYLATTDAREVEERIGNDDDYARLIYHAMAYQIGKEIGSYATVLKGRVDNIILTGGLAYSDYLVNTIKEMVGFISQVIVYPGEDEMDALNQGALRVLEGQEEVKIYENEVE